MSGNYTGRDSSLLSSAWLFTCLLAYFIPVLLNLWASLLYW